MGNNDEKQHYQRVSVWILINFRIIYIWFWKVLTYVLIGVPVYVCKYIIWFLCVFLYLSCSCIHVCVLKSTCSSWTLYVIICSRVLLEVQHQNIRVHPQLCSLKVVGTVGGTICVSIFGVYKNFILPL